MAEKNERRPARAGRWSPFSELDLFEPDGVDPKDRVEVMVVSAEALALYHSGEHAGAGRILRDLFDGSPDGRPDLASAHELYGKVAAAGGRFDEAVTHFRASLRARPRHAETITHLAAALLHSGATDEALAVLAGAVCGVGAAIPTSLLIVMVSRRRDEVHGQRMQASTPQGVYPPVVVVAPPGGQQRAGDWNTLSPPLTAPMQRQFTVVGGAQEAQWLNSEVMSHEHYS